MYQSRGTWFSTDGRWRWDGRRWVARASVRIPVNVIGFALVLGLAWAALLAVTGIASGVAVLSPAILGPFEWLAIGLLGTVLLGAVAGLGLRRMEFVHALGATTAGSTVPLGVAWWFLIVSMEAGQLEEHAAYLDFALSLLMWAALDAPLLVGTGVAWKIARTR